MDRADSCRLSLSFIQELTSKTNKSNKWDFYCIPCDFKMSFNLRALLKLCLLLAPYWHCFWSFSEFYHFFMFRNLTVVLFLIINHFCNGVSQFEIVGYSFHLAHGVSGTFVNTGSYCTFVFFSLYLRRVDPFCLLFEKSDGWISKVAQPGFSHSFSPWLLTLGSHQNWGVFRFFLRFVVCAFRTLWVFTHVCSCLWRPESHANVFLYDL